MIGIGDYDWWEEEELEQDENRGQSKLAEPRKAWKHKFYDNNNEDENSNP